MRIISKRTPSSTLGLAISITKAIQQDTEPSIKTINRKPITKAISIDPEFIKVVANKVMAIIIKPM
ncbi:toxin-antitoxin system, antitoxin component, HicB domain protein [Alloscardovia omnicolens]|uniref:Toxin-antitoxin system, antitoxin component, HicB domain protein n=1 Tax=Alloscardovia omnicolens F0580 TaxID=1321816 RepID=U1SHU9_9BIFI|nr:toxin-antitoxin system, antitoxin component, HicB domain protein [Alloscardovia omnicolens F0580]KWZ73319.1 toxin-antitoxin system, antitoxin component, HicB domain protein [Alloscardovia omnicolens]